MLRNDGPHVLITAAEGRELTALRKLRWHILGIEAVYEKTRAITGDAHCPGYVMWAEIVAAARKAEEAKNG